MKSLKIYIGVVLVLLTLGIGLGVYVWYTLQTLETVVQTEVTSPNEENIEPRASLSKLKERFPT